jgi:hypothetical protein
MLLQKELNLEDKMLLIQLGRQNWKFIKVREAKSEI